MSISPDHDDIPKQTGRFHDQPGVHAALLRAAGAVYRRANPHQASDRHPLNTTSASGDQIKGLVKYALTGC